MTDHASSLLVCIKLCPSAILWVSLLPGPVAGLYARDWQALATPMQLPTSVTREKSPIVYKSCPKMISLEK